MPKHEPVVIYVTANTKNVYEKQCMMHAGSLCQEFDHAVYTQRGHGKELRSRGTKLTDPDRFADEEVQERIVFCHVLDMREGAKAKFMQA